MATNVADLLNAERGKNSALVSNGASISSIINQSNSAAIASAQSLQTGVQDLEKGQKEALAARQLAAQVAFQTATTQQNKLAEELAALNVRTAQTKEVQSVLLAEQNRKAQEVGQKTIEVNNTSFFKNPIAWFTTRSGLNDAKGDLEGVSAALVDINNTIDSEYAVASKNFREFQSSKTMIAQRQAELDAKLAAEKEQMDVQLAAQRSEANTKGLQIMATQLKVDPLALKREELAMEEASLKRRQDSASKAAKDVYGVEALGAAYGLDLTRPDVRMQVATSYERLSDADKQKWNSVQLALLQGNKPFTPESVMNEFKVRNDTAGYLKVLEASDPELHGEIMRGVTAAAFQGKDQQEQLTKAVKELTLANESATGKNKLTPQQIENKVKQGMFDAVLNQGIDAVLSAGTTEVRQKLSAIGSKAPAETLSGNAIAVWAEQVEGLEPKTIEALKSPNTILAYDTGHKVGEMLSAIDPQASRVIAGVEKMVAMGVSEEQATKAYSTIMRKAAEGYIRAIPEGKYLLERYKKVGVEIPLAMTVPSIDLNFSIFSGASLQATQERELDLFNPTDLQNYLARVRKQTQADTINESILLTPTSPRF